MKIAVYGNQYQDHKVEEIRALLRRCVLLGRSLKWNAASWSMSKG